MRLLLDTHIFLWSVTNSRKLSEPARQMMRAADEAYVSAASIWEIAIKARLGKIEGDAMRLANAIADSGFIELAISAGHAAAVSRLDMHHADPFDRLLIAQAVTEPLILVTADPILAQYSNLVHVV